MIEWVMLFALGFCTAGLIALLAIPTVWRRAVAITGRRMRGALPVSMSEIQADKDQMRAEFAMSARRLERSVEELKHRTANHQAEIGKRDELIRSLKGEIAGHRRTEDDLMTRIDSLEARATKHEKTVLKREETIAQRDTTLSEREAQLLRREAELAEANAQSDTRRVEIVALKTRIDALGATIEDRDTAIQTRDGDLADRDERITALDRLLAEKTTELAAREAEIRRLRASIEKQAQSLAESESNTAGLKRALSAERKVVGEKEKAIADLQADVRERNAEAGRLAAQLAAANKDRVRAEERLKLTVAETQDMAKRGMAKRPSGAVPTGARNKSASDAEWEAEKRENAMLRERLNDLTAEVVNLTAALDGENGEIAAATREALETIEAEANGAADGTRSLAERIRALQNQVARQ